MVTAPVGTPSVKPQAACVIHEPAEAAAGAARAAIQAALRAESHTINISYENVAASASDFGGIYHHRPAAVVYPATVDDIARLLRALSRVPNIIIAARGNGHSINGQAQAQNGVVIDMRSLKDPASISVGRDADGSFYADVGAGRLWIEVLDATLRHPGLALAPRTWPDYLHLSVGGTLQNAGIGGQTFKHGPQISNVSRLDVMTVNGELKSCSSTSNSELFYASLGGLGQFGIITKARILLEAAPQKVRWMRLMYTDFKEFTQDQERLISRASSIFCVDYVEGFVVTNSNDPTAGWPQVPLPEGAAFNHHLLPPNAGPMLYCLELAKYYNDCDNTAVLDQQISGMLRPLRFVEGLRFQVDVSYRDFLNRVHTGEPQLRKAGLWDAPHPWMCLFVPRSHILAFDSLIFKQSKLVRKGVGGPMLVYPMLRSKWDYRTSAAIPDEDVFYLVALLRFSLPRPQGPSVERLVQENEEIVQTARANKIAIKYYLPHFTRHADWKEHFGYKWNHFCYLKSKLDPQAILSPGQAIFPPHTTTSNLFHF